MSRGHPEDLRDLDAPTDATARYTADIQALMAAAGVAPFSGSMLVGAVSPATTVALGTTGGALAAAAHADLPHNAHSPFRRHALGGLVPVAEAPWGKGLGRHINARRIVTSFRDLDVTHTDELVSASNEASRRMVQSCGLRHEPDLVCGIATSRTGTRLTR